MGRKGEKRSELARNAADSLVERLTPLGDVTHRGMFGGYGIFLGGKMFGLVSSAGEAHLRADATSETDFLEAGSHRHGKMPYYTIPGRVLRNDARLLEWARTAAAGVREAAGRP